MNATGKTGSGHEPLTAELRDELKLAKVRGKAIRRAAGVASFNGWGIGILAALSAPFAIFNVVGFLLTVGLGFVAYNEFRGRKRLLAFDPSAAAFLGWNQIGLLALLVVYCVWMLISGLSSATAELQSMKEYEETLGSLEGLDELFRYVLIAFYGTVIVLSIVFQGLNSLYYFTRRKYITEYIENTPKWVQEIENSLLA